MNDYDNISRLMAHSKKHQDVIQNLKNLNSTIDVSYNELKKKLAGKTTELKNLHKENTILAEIYGNIIEACSIK